MKKHRNLFSELQEGFSALQAEREGTLTLTRQRPEAVLACEQSLSEWNSTEEDQAWKHLQQTKSS
jgi:hypothetical protein